MKKVMIAVLTLLLYAGSMAQSRVKGHVTEKNVASPVVNATIRMPDGKTVLTDSNGYFTLQPRVPGRNYPGNQRRWFQNLFRKILYFPGKLGNFPRTENTAYGTGGNPGSEGI